MKGIRSFKNISRVIQHYRNERCISQSQLASEIGYRNGQFISNVERGLCSIPAEKIYSTSLALVCEPGLIIDAIIKDETMYLVDTVRSNIEKVKSHKDLPPLPGMIQ